MPVTTVRPGHVIKSVLESGPATCSEMHREYKSQVKEARQDPRCRQKGMTYDSFRRLVWCATKANLIEIAYTQDCMVSNLCTTTNVYTLTDHGANSYDPWDNLICAVAA